jgi:hypothetical protein
MIAIVMLQFLTFVLALALGMYVLIVFLFRIR